MKTIIFDLDGTLLDTLEDLKNAVNHALFTYNLPLKTKEDVRIAIGNGTKVLIKRCTPCGIPEDLRQRVFDCFKDYYFAHYFENTKPYTSILKLLKDLKAKGLLLAVASNKDNDLTNALINNELPNIFDAIQGSYPDLPKKPDPFLLNKIIKDLNVNKNDCLYIGDTNVDKESADNAGLKYLLVNYGYRNKEELIKMCPNDTSISTVEELYNSIIEWVNL